VNCHVFVCVNLASFSDFGLWVWELWGFFFIPFKALAHKKYVYVSNILISILDSGHLCAYWDFNIDKTYVFNDSFLITFKSDDQQSEHGFVLSYVERKDNTTEEQTSIKPEVETTTNIELSTTQQSTSNTADAIETTETTVVDSTTVILQGTSNYDSTFIEVHCI